MSKITQRQAEKIIQRISHCRRCNGNGVVDINITVRSGLYSIGCTCGAHGAPMTTIRQAMDNWDLINGRLAPDEHTHTDLANIMSLPPILRRQAS